MTGFGGLINMKPRLVCAVRLCSLWQRETKVQADVLRLEELRQENL